MPVAGPAAQRHDADVLVEEQIERDALLGAAAVDTEDLPVAAHQAHISLGGDPAERLAALGLEDQSGVHGQFGGFGYVQRLLPVEQIHLLGGEGQFRHSRPAGVGDGEFGAVLLGEEADRGRLDTQRQVLGDDRDVVPLGLEVARDREDP